jgi:hypothetical protein
MKKTLMMAAMAVVIGATAAQAHGYDRGYNSYNDNSHSTPSLVNVNANVGSQHSGLLNLNANVGGGNSLLGLHVNVGGLATVNANVGGSTQSSHGCDFCGHDGGVGHW